jgi:RNA polymerase sigma-70 factor (ECF subfamily)
MIEEDAELVERVLAGEKFGYGLPIDRHRPDALKVARRILGEAFDAENVAQEALLQAFLGLASLRNRILLDRGC